MKKLLIPVLLVLLPFVTAELQLAPCEDWYEYGSVEFTSFIVDKPGYNSGDPVVISGRLINNNDFPLVEGSIRIQIVRIEGGEMIDEFYAKEDVSLWANESLSFKTTWQMPHLKAGDYEALVYFSVADVYNLAGVSFLRGMQGAKTPFEVNSGIELLSFDTNQLKINGEIKDLNSLSAEYNENTPFEITVPIKNDGAASQAEIKYELYSWDDLDGTPLTQYSRQETVDLAAGSRLLTYDLPGLRADAYLVKITAEGKNRAILKFRLPVIGLKAKSYFAGLSKFPLMEGDEARLFLCFGNSASPLISFSEDINETGPEPEKPLSAALVLKDQNGVEVFRDSIQNAFGTYGWTSGAAAFTPDDDYDKVTLVVETSDGVNIDVEEMTYDYSKFSQDLEIGVEATVSDRTVVVKVSVEDKRGMVQKRRMNIYALDQDKKAIPINPEAEVEGTYSKAVTLDPGIYTIKAVDLQTYAQGQAKVIVKALLPPTPPPKEAPDYTPYIVGGILIVIIVLYYALKRK
jgi:hypothetical protein